MSLNRPTDNSGHVYRLQSRVAILLGLPGDPDQSLTRALAEADLELLTDASFFPVPEAADPLEPADLGHLAEHLRYSYQPVPPTEPESAPDQQRRLFDEIDYLRHRVLSDSILRHGVFLDRYRVAVRDEGNGFPILFRRDDRELWWQLATYDTREQAIAAVNDLRRLLARLSIESEGLHLVEHLRLRPLAASGQEALDDPEARREFYSFKLSVFWPAWTARFSDPGFQRLAENTVRENCPAHIHPEFHWLDFSRMKLLEELLQRWRTTRSDADASPEAIDAASLELTRFIISPDHVLSEPPGESR